MTGYTRTTRSSIPTSCSYKTSSDCAMGLLGTELGGKRVPCKTFQVTKYQVLSHVLLPVA